MVLLRRAALPFLSAVILVACGGSRASRPGGAPCSNAKAMVTDSKTARTQLLPGETYDPSAALLIFSATSDQVKIESRCNARLVHKLVSKHSVNGTMQGLEARETDAQGRPLGINVDTVTFEISNDPQNMELHTSGHCFFRVWDPRIETQVKQNPSLRVMTKSSIAGKQSKSPLTNNLVRYQLYKSMLTSPQKLIVYNNSNGFAPVEFEYKLKTHQLYSEFFEKIDAQRSDQLKEIVGRELSKASIALDELVLDSCGADAKIEAREPILKNPSELISLIVRSKTAGDTGEYDDSNDKMIKEFFRRKLASEGRHKLCFSQTDFVVAPIDFVNQLTPAQVEVIEKIFDTQRNNARTFENEIRNNAINTSDTNELRFVTEFKPSSPPLGTASQSGQCAPYWLNTYPGLSATQTFNQNFSGRLSQFTANTIPVPKNFQVLANAVPSGLTMFNHWMSQELRKERCEFEGGILTRQEPAPPGSDPVFICQPRNASNQSFSSVNPSKLHRIEKAACPPASMTTDSGYREEAARVHLNSNASFRMAFLTPLISLERQRALNKFSLTLPLAMVADATRDHFLNLAHPNEKPRLQTLRQILSELNTKADFSEQVSPFNTVRVDRVDEEFQTYCSLQNVADPSAESSSSTKTPELYRYVSPAGKALLNAGFSGDIWDKYHNFGARFLFLRCIAASSQLFYMNYRQAPGLINALRFAEVTFVTSSDIPSEGRFSLTNAEMVDSGRPIRISLPTLILGYNQTFRSPSVPKNAQELAAQMMGTGHMQIGYCKGTSHEATQSYCSAELVNDDYLRIQKNRYPADFQFGARFAAFDPDVPNAAHSKFQGVTPQRALSHALPRLYAHLNFVTEPPKGFPLAEPEQYGNPIFPSNDFSTESRRYFLSGGDSGTTVSLFGLFPSFMLSTVQDIPVSGGLAVIPVSGGQVVQPNASGACR